MPRALITGITGQDGSYLADLLLKKGYEVHGMIRRCSTSSNLERLNPILDRIYLHEGDMLDGVSLIKVVSESQPDEVYNLAAQSHVGTSFNQPEVTANINALGVMRLLEACRELPVDPKFYQASTSELFGNAMEASNQFMLNEEAPMHPVSPYAIAKLYAYWTVKQYREQHNMFTCNGILFNHESPRRGIEFVTQKVCTHVGWVGSAKRGYLHPPTSPLMIGNIESRRDWSHAEDFVHGMWLMLQCVVPGDYVLASGRNHTIKELIDTAFGVIGVKLFWEGEGTSFVTARDIETNELMVQTDPKFWRPIEVHQLAGDASKAHQVLGYQPGRSFEELVEEMVNAQTIVARI